MSGSKLFRRNRCMGYVSNSIPAVTRYIQRRKDNLITTCVGRSFQVYTASHFRLLHVSGVHPDEITCMATDRFYIYTASNKSIYVWRAGKHIHHVLKDHNKDVHLLLPFKFHLIAVDGENILKVWDVKKETVYLEIPFAAEQFKISALAHPPTYINKILLGSEQGPLQLWNIKDNKLVYTFIIKNSKVLCLEPAPAIDTIAVGYQDGSIVIHNMKFDEMVMEFKQEWGAVTGITFRTDGFPIMATSSTNGNIAFWNLEERKIANQLQAHASTITTLICFANEPIMLTTSPDNSIKLWIFDMSDGGARLLRIRDGHTAPPLCIRYHGATGTSIISSGEDSSMRIFSVISETLNKSLGKASYNRKASKKKSRLNGDPFIMPPIVQFTNETTRDKEWDSIAAIHSGIIQTTTWSFHKQRMGEHRLVPEKFFNKNRKDFNSQTTCLILTHCGNFVIIGYSSGDVERFNIQSGIHRCSYGAPAHKTAVRGVSCDSLNQIVVSGGSDGIVKFWNFKEGVKEPTTNIDMHTGISMFRSHRESGMLCVALDNFCIYVIDCDTRAVVRKFKGHSRNINDATFSPDGRWLITSAMDSTIKIWDIPSSYMIDHFKVERPCVSLTMSPTGDFLATAHVGYLGIYLWANKMAFSQISLRSINPDDEAPYIDLPSNAQDEVSLETAIEEMTIEEGESLDINYETPDQLSDKLITLSGLAASRWANLLDLDVIKKRNKPKAPPKAPKQAPFFLPTIAGTEFKFDLSNSLNNNKSSKILTSKHFSNLTTFGKLLEETLTTEDYEKPFEHLKSLGPSMIDFELKSLHPIGGGSYKAMLQFLKTIVFIFETNSNFELAQAYLATFLKAHGRSLTETVELIDYLKTVEKVQNESWKKLEDKFFYGLGVVTALRNYIS